MGVSRREFLARAAVAAGVWIAAPAALAARLAARVPDGAAELVKNFTSPDEPQGAGAGRRGEAEAPVVWLRGGPRRCSGWREERGRERV